MLVIGGGGHALVSIEVLRACGHDVVGMPHAGRRGIGRPGAVGCRGRSGPTATSPRSSPTTHPRGVRRRRRQPGQADGCRRPSWPRAGRWCRAVSPAAVVSLAADIDDGVARDARCGRQRRCPPRTRRDRQHPRLHRPRLPDRRLRPRRARGRPRRRRRRRRGRARRHRRHRRARPVASARGPPSAPARPWSTTSLPGETVVGVPARPLRPGHAVSDAPRILVVCTGNLCRSPLVEALLRRELAAEDIAAEVSSAGLAAPPAARPDRRLRRVAGELGVDVDDHRSRPVIGRRPPRGRPHPDDDERADRAGARPRPLRRRSRGDAARGRVEGPESSAGGRCRSPSGCVASPAT